jgi:Polyketide cyclase / dehydrase and lipid transport
MSKTGYEVSYTAPMAASPKSVYRVIADYHNGHPRILPSAFRNMVVEKGGVGAGTQTRFEVHAFGQTQSIRHEVFEPEPGRVLVERDRDGDSQTTFTVDPDGGGSRVTIHSELLSRSGVAGIIERFLSRRFLLRLYREELANLEREAQRAR